MAPALVVASIPSPARGVWYVGPFPVRAYALAILAGVLVAIWVGDRRWRARGGRAGTVADVAVWAVPFGLVGGRFYHVITTWQAYADDPVRALYVWRGGLGIPGALAFGALGAWLAAHRRGLHLPSLADALAPGIALGQAIGRWGNYANQELYGRPTSLPWGLAIDPAHRPAATPDAATYHPTFLYESLWDVGVALVVIWADRRFRLGGGRAFALYLAAYAAGRLWIEALRVDPAHHILGVRLNDWVALVVLLGALGYLVVRRGAGRVAEVEPAPPASVDA